MKKITLILTAVLVVACGNQNKKEQHEQETTPKIAENSTTEEEQEIPILLGIQKREALQKTPYDEWFDENYAYIPDEETLKALSKKLNDKTIIVFMGTWCDDSKLQVPAFFKILDAINFDENKVQIITMSRDKDTPKKLEEGYDIEFVPTIIVKKDGKELGRIVESPVDTLEADLLTIASGKEYKHIYAE